MLNRLCVFTNCVSSDSDSIFVECIAELCCRYAALLQREVKSRDTAETNELQFKRDLEELKVVHKHLQSDYHSLQETFNIKQHAWETEKSLTAHDWHKRLLQVTADKEQAMASVHLETQQKISEISRQFDGQMKEFERVVSEATRSQLEGEKIREMGLMQMKCQGEIEAVRTDERRLCVLEIDRVKTVFLTRERETAEDIIELEKVLYTNISDTTLLNHDDVINKFVDLLLYVRSSIGRMIGP